jgi:hypothetical protein
MVAFKVSMKGLSRMRRVLHARVVMLRVRRTVVVEMSQRGDGEEKDERSDLQRGKEERKESTAHSALFSSALLPKST